MEQRLTLPLPDARMSLGTGGEFPTGQDYVAVVLAMTGAVPGVSAGILWLRYGIWPQKKRLRMIGLTLWTVGIVLAFIGWKML